MTLETPEEIERYALRQEVLRRYQALSPEQRAAFDMLWPDGMYDIDELRVAFRIMGRMLPRENFGRSPKCEDRFLGWS